MFREAFDGPAQTPPPPPKGRRQNGMQGLSGAEKSGILPMRLAVKVEPNAKERANLKVAGHHAEGGVVKIYWSRGLWATGARRAVRFFVMFSLVSREKLRSSLFSSFCFLFFPGLFCHSVVIIFLACEGHGALLLLLLLPDTLLRFGTL